MREHHDQVVVASVDVHIVDSTQRANLITSQMVLKALGSEKIVGKKLRELDIVKLEEMVAKNDFVESVKIYCNYNGDMHIEVSQRQAMARLLINGHNCYIDEGGYIFSAPRTAALYVPVVTGDFPLFVPKGFKGEIDDYMLERIVKIEESIEEIEIERYPVLMRDKENRQDRSELRRRFTTQKPFESREDYVARFTALKISNQKTRELYTYRQRMIDRDMAAIDRRVEAKRREQQKVMDQCDEIHNLITFIKMLESDRFWRSEVVQLIATAGDRGEMRLSMVVRSGNFEVMLGELFGEHGDVARREEDTIEELKQLKQQVLESPKQMKASQLRAITGYRGVERRFVRKYMDAKLDRVRYFYDKALERVGWDIYRSINVEFENQVVCRK